MTHWHIDPLCQRLQHLFTLYRIHQYLLLVVGAEYRDLRRNALQQADTQSVVATEDHAGAQATQARRQHWWQLAFAGLPASSPDPPFVIPDPTQDDQGVVVTPPPVEPLYLVVVGDPLQTAEVLIRQ